MPLHVKNSVNTLAFFKEKDLEEIAIPLPEVISQLWGFGYVFLLEFCRDNWLGFYPRIFKINGKVVGFGLRSQGCKNIFFPVSEPAPKGGRKIPGVHGSTSPISARIRDV